MENAKIALISVFAIAAFVIAGALGNSSSDRHNTFARHTVHVWGTYLIGTQAADNNNEPAGVFGYGSRGILLLTHHPDLETNYKLWQRRRRCWLKNIGYISTSYRCDDNNKKNSNKSNNNKKSKAVQLATLNFLYIYINSDNSLNYKVVIHR
jgi:hypothetical protein